MNLTVDIHSEAVVARLQAMNGAVRSALKKTVVTEAIKVQARVMQKLAGEVLNERTHHLHDSIHYETRETATGIFAVVGTNVVYAAYHEYGFHGTQEVREHLRRVSVAFGRPIATVEANVRAHQRRVNYPARSFMRTTLAEKATEIKEAIETALEKVAHG